MDAIGHILHVLLYITQDTSPGTHTPITTTLPIYSSSLSYIFVTIDIFSLMVL